MKISPNFDLVELVDPVTYKQRGDKSIELLDNRLITLAQAFSDFFEVSITINNWATGGQYHESGLRRLDTTTGAKLSQHKFGRAADFKIEGISPEEARNSIRKNWAFFKSKGLTTIEKDTPTWVHADCRFTGLDSLYEVPYQ